MPHPFLQRLLTTPQASGQIFKDDENGFSSVSDMCFMPINYEGFGDSSKKILITKAKTFLSPSPPDNKKMSQRSDKKEFKTGFKTMRP